MHQQAQLEAQVTALRDEFSTDALQRRPYLFTAIAQAEASGMCSTLSQEGGIPTIQAIRPCDAEAVLDIVGVPWSHRAIVDGDGVNGPSTRFLIMPDGLDSTGPVIEVAQWDHGGSSRLCIAPKITEFPPDTYASAESRNSEMPANLDIRLAEGPECIWSEIHKTRAPNPLAPGPVLIAGRQPGLGY